MTLLGCPTPLIHSTLSEWNWLQRCVIPVIHEVTLRFFLGDLIVGSRLYFLKSLNPTVQQCVRRSCVAIETVEHCFFSCPALDEVWTTMWRPWSQVFIAKLDWWLLLFPKPRDLRANWRRHQKEVLLWRVHTSIAFHGIWRLRNDIYFHETDANKPNTQSVKATFGRHCQLIFRHSTELGFGKHAVCVTLRRLGFEEPCEEIIPPSPRRIWIPRQ
ncbi:hypothetical protein PHYSODRAFT_466606 [Phytophthora sojae]|uniref:Reverse transcriptase zinc-binding domain-containing protein n=1 Tax=Phytophthora sojae (strain P6497) TaxID=1094619 RepID=G4YHP9_PHYSP|nr:hypothetical protein PHYSODRAFT_466606 [Phytophthora sojae]EGZ29367.1 hypothetical protein PHYSODRAFT_466606 [Phytophthora sojae]|eukprot:XP_009516642.1 hypothetical protein PHYSODRAFT_466606 [Phytophthora sojae]